MKHRPIPVKHYKQDDLDSATTNSCLKTGETHVWNYNPENEGQYKCVCGCTLEK